MYKKIQLSFLLTCFAGLAFFLVSIPAYALDVAENAQVMKMTTDTGIDTDYITSDESLIFEGTSDGTFWVRVTAPTGGVVPGTDREVTPTDNEWILDFEDDGIKMTEEGEYTLIFRKLEEDDDNKRIADHTFTIDKTGPAGAPKIVNVAEDNRIELSEATQTHVLGNITSGAYSTSIILTDINDTDVEGVAIIKTNCTAEEGVGCFDLILDTSLLADGNITVSHISADETGNETEEEIDMPTTVVKGNIPANQCTDGLDNDNDGWADAQDPDCADGGTQESGFGSAQCNDGIDNDNDDAVDALDSDCYSAIEEETTETSSQSYISGHTWKDLNENGIQDEPLNSDGIREPFEGVTVRLMQGTTQIEETVTNQYGSYSFGPVDNSVYDIIFTSPEGYTISPKDQGSDETKDSDIDSAGKVTISLPSTVNWDAGFFEGQPEAAPSISSITRLTPNTQDAVVDSATHEVTLTWQIVFSEPVKDFTRSDIGIGHNGSPTIGIPVITDLGDATTYNISVLVSTDTPSGIILSYGTWEVLDLDDNAVPNTLGSFDVAFNVTLPDPLSHKIPATGPGTVNSSNMGTITWQLVFEQPVQDFTNADIEIGIEGFDNGSGQGSAIDIQTVTVSNPSEDSRTYEIQVIYSATEEGTLVFSQHNWDVTTAEDSAPVTFNFSEYEARNFPIVIPGTVDIVNNPRTFSLEEGLTEIGVITATPAEDGDILTFSLPEYIVDDNPDDEITPIQVQYPDGALFEINATTGALSFKTAPDFENPTDHDTNNEYHVNIQVSNQEGESDLKSFVITVTDKDEALYPPVISNNPLSASLAENSTEAITITATDANEGDTLTFSLPEYIQDENPDDNIAPIQLQHLDGALFEINTTTGLLSFKTAPDFENPTDHDTDNEYHVTVLVSDQTGRNNFKMFTITVTNVNDVLPEVSNPTEVEEVNENQIGAVDVNATDTDGDTLTYSLRDEPNSDNALFNINSETGLITFKTAPDFETPQDRDANNYYELETIVSDGVHEAGRTGFVIHVNDVLELNTPIFEAGTWIDVTAPERQVKQWQMEVSNIDDIPVEFSLETEYPNGAVDYALFEIDAETGILSLKDGLTYVGDALHVDHLYDVKVNATNTDTNSKATIWVRLEITNVPDSPRFITEGQGHNVPENSTRAITIEAEDFDPDDTITFKIMNGEDGEMSALQGEKFNIDASTGVLTFKTAPDFEVPTGNDGTNLYMVNIRITDDSYSHYSTDLTFYIHVTDVDENIRRSGGGGSSHSWKPQNTPPVGTQNPPLQRVFSGNAHPDQNSEEFRFEHNLQRGMSHPDVEKLQQRLKEEGFYRIRTFNTQFSLLTQFSLKKYQRAHNIFPANGELNEITRGILNGDISDPEVEPESEFRFTRDLYPRDRNNDVKELQKKLHEEGFYRNARASGHFGLSTRRALQNYQDTHHTSKERGYVGPITRALLNGDEIKARVGDFVWNDSNANGKYDFPEKGINGVTLELLQNGTAIAQTTSQNKRRWQKGAYEFTNLALGDYQIRVSNLPENYVITKQNNADEQFDSDINPFTMTTSFTLTPDDMYLPENGVPGRFSIDVGMYNSYQEMICVVDGVNYNLSRRGCKRLGGEYKRERDSQGEDFNLEKGNMRAITSVQETFTPKDAAGTKAMFERILQLRKEGKVAENIWDGFGVGKIDHHNINADGSINLEGITGNGALRNIGRLGKLEEMPGIPGGIESTPDSFPGQGGLGGFPGQGSGGTTGTPGADGIGDIFDGLPGQGGVGLPGTGGSNAPGHGGLGGIGQMPGQHGGTGGAGHGGIGSTGGSQAGGLGNTGGSTGNTGDEMAGGSGDTSGMGGIGSDFGGMGGLGGNSGSTGGNSGSGATDGNIGDDNHGNDTTNGMVGDMLGNIGGPSDTHAGIGGASEGDGVTYGVDASRNSDKSSSGGQTKGTTTHESTVRGSDGSVHYTYKENRKDGKGNSATIIYVYHNDGNGNEKESLTIKTETEDGETSSSQEFRSGSSDGVGGTGGDAGGDTGAGAGSAGGAATSESGEGEGEEGETGTGAAGGLGAAAGATGGENGEGDGDGATPAGGAGESGDEENDDNNNDKDGNGVPDDWENDDSDNDDEGDDTTDDDAGEDDCTGDDCGGEDDSSSSQPADGSEGDGDYHDSSNPPSEAEVALMFRRLAGLLGHAGGAGDGRVEGTGGDSDDEGGELDTGDCGADDGTSCGGEEKGNGAGMTEAPDAGHAGGAGDGRVDRFKETGGITGGVPRTPATGTHREGARRDVRR